MSTAAVGITLSEPRRRARSLVAPLLAVAVAGLALQLGWHGVDWPAQLYRVHLFQSNGWVSFDTGWYGGNVPAAYSTLYPPVAALLGMDLVVVASVAGAAWAFDHLVGVRFGPTARLGSLCFAGGMVVQVVIGQLSFLLGLALGLAALVAMRGDRTRTASLLALACALASFVAALFLVLAAIAVWATAPRPARVAAAAVAAAAAAPVVIVAVAYHQAGRFPFPATTLAAVLVACLGGLVVIPVAHRTLRVGVYVYAAMSVALFMLRTPVGANDARLATTLAAPLLLCAGRRRVVVAFLVTFLIAWEVAPALGAVNISQRDASTSRGYYTSLIAEMHRVAPGPTRLEIPLTHEHWETAWVAPTIPLARGWERQLDITDNALFYRSGPLHRSTYHSWLRANGVGWVALPRAPLDYSARSEARLLHAGAPYLERVWSNHDWVLWKVEGTRGLVSGPARLTELGVDHFTLAARARGTAVVRVRYSATWSIVDADGGSCLDRTRGAWTQVRVRRPGIIRVVAQVLPRAADAC